MPQKRLDTHLQSNGAEFLVLGQLLIRGVPTYKTYMRHPDYDLIAANPDAGRTVTVQVKSRYGSDYDRSFPIRSFDCDFVVHVALNRGNQGYSRTSRKRLGEDVAEPEFYVFPSGVVKAAHDVQDQRIRAVGRQNKWHKTYLKDIPNLDRYREDWDAIRKSLKLPEILPPAKDTS